MSVRDRIRDLLSRMTDVDPHEFATMYVDHVESSGHPMEVERALRQWVQDGSLTRPDLRFPHR